MASLGSSTRSAARATFSAYRSVPIRWRLAGGSAVLTFVILAGLRRDRRTFHRCARCARVLRRGAVRVAAALKWTHRHELRRLDCGDLVCPTSPSPTTRDPRVRRTPATSSARRTGSGRTDQSVQPGLHRSDRARAVYQDGYRVAGLSWKQDSERQWFADLRAPALEHSTTRSPRSSSVLDARRRSAARVLALLAGLADAQRAIRPIAQLTDAAREIERTRDPSRRIPPPEADDEISELARTLEGMLGALDAAARRDRGGAAPPARVRRRRLARAAHAADERARQPRAARRRARGRAGRLRQVRAALDPADAPARRRPAAARARRRRAHASRIGRPTSPRS